ncbi:MAG: hypothetical protein QXM53_06760 [Thermofilaceae archaeon]
MRAEWRVVVNRTSEEEIVKKLSELGLIVTKTEKGYVIFDKNTIGVIKYGLLRVRIETKDIKVAEEMTKIFGMPDRLEL